MTYGVHVRSFSPRQESLAFYTDAPPTPAEPPKKGKEVRPEQWSKNTPGTVVLGFGDDFILPSYMGIIMSHYKDSY